MGNIGATEMVPYGVSIAQTQMTARLLDSSQTCQLQVSEETFRTLRAKSLRNTEAARLQRGARWGYA